VVHFRYFTVNAVTSWMARATVSEGKRKVAVSWPRASFSVIDVELGVVA